MHRILMLMVVFIGGHPGTDLTGASKGGAHIWAIALNLTPQNLVVGGQDFGLKEPKFGAEVTVLENFSDFVRKIFA